MMTGEAAEQKLLKLKREVEQAKSAHDQAQGKLQGLMERLKKEFECTSLEMAELKVTELEEEADRLEEEITEGLVEIKEKWGLG